MQSPFRRLSSVVRGQSSAVANETIWALKDVSFEVQRGEVVASLRQAPGTASQGRSAQDKHRAQRGGEDHAYFDGPLVLRPKDEVLSTRLKILSRITDPTEGHAEIHGRVGSLLEVGTGFHPELTGWENIYLNGTIPSTGSGQAWG